MTIDQAVLRTLGSDELALSELTRVFSRGILLRAFERLVTARRVTCRFDGSDYFYRAR